MLTSSMTVGRLEESSRTTAAAVTGAVSAIISNDGSGCTATRRQLIMLFHIYVQLCFRSPYDRHQQSVTAVLHSRHQPGDSRTENTFRQLLY